MDEWRPVTIGTRILKAVYVTAEQPYLPVVWRMVEQNITGMKKVGNSVALLINSDLYITYESDGDVYMWFYKECRSGYL